MTFAELKRTANSGTLTLEMVERYGKTGDAIPERLRGARRLVRANSVALFFRNADGRESELRIDRASLVDFDGKELTVYNPAERDFTEQEQRVVDAWREKQKKIAETEPWRDTYWPMMAHFMNSSCPWLCGDKPREGKCMTGNREKVRDWSMKGETILRYRVVA